MTIIRHEGHVRDWVRKRGGEGVFWIEHGRGGTLGLQDSMVALDIDQINFLVPLELKVGWFGNDGTLTYKMRLGQAVVARRMARCGWESF